MEMLKTRIADAQWSDERKKRETDAAAKRILAQEKRDANAAKEAKAEAKAKANAEREASVERLNRANKAKAEAKAKAFEHPKATMLMRDDVVGPPPGLERSTKAERNFGSFPAIIV